MPGGVNNVSMVNGVNPIDPVGQAIAEQQAQRQQQLADTLRQQSLQPIHVDSGNISWSQGLAQLAQGIAANHINRRAMAGQYQAATQAANAQMQAATPRGQVANLPYDPNNNPYSGNGQHRTLIQKLGDFVGGGPPVGRVGAAQPANAAPYQSVPNQAPPMATAPVQGGGIPASNNAPLPVNQGAGPTPTVGQPAPSQMGVVSSPAPPPSGAVMGTGAMSLTGDPQRDISLSRLYPQEFGKAVVGNATPTDIAKQLTQAGIDPNSDQGRQYMIEAARKAALTPIGDDRRGYLYDPYTGALKGYHAMLDAGQHPTADAYGNVNGVQTLPGFAQSTEEIAGAGARGKAQGDLTDVVDPVTGRHSAVPTSGLLGGNGGGGGPGSLQKTYGTPAATNAAPVNNVTGLSPAEIAAGTARGTASAARFDGYTQAAQGSQERQTQLGNIIRLTGSNSFGPGSEGMANVAGYINTALRGTLGHDAIDPKGANATAEFTKYATQLAASQSAAMGLGGTDSKFAAIMAAVPNPHLQNGAAREMARYFLDNEAAIQAKANASTTFAKQRGSENSDQFEQSWRNSYDRSNPIDTRILSAVHQGAPVFQALVKALPPNEANYAIERYKNLRRMGAF